MNSAGSRKKSERNQPAAKASEKVLFDVWFTCKLSEDSKIRPEQRREIGEFMKSHGLSGSEERERYEELLRKY